MQPTYSFQEIKALIRSLDFSSISLLKELIEEEMDCYDQYEIKALKKFELIKYKTVVRSEVKAEFLLSFN